MASVSAVCTPCGTLFELARDGTQTTTIKDLLAFLKAHRDCRVRGDVVIGDDTREREYVNGLMAAALKPLGDYGRIFSDARFGVERLLSDDELRGICEHVKKTLDQQ